METCGALVAVLPFREDSDYGKTSKWVLEEVQIAAELSIPYLIFAIEGVDINTSLVEKALGRRLFRISSEPNEVQCSSALELLDEAYVNQKNAPFAFLATSIKDANSDAKNIADVVSTTTNMECIIGQNLRGQHAQREIIKRIQGAQFVLADVSDTHLNSLIEAGIARGSEVPLHLIRKIPDSGDLKTRFMFSDLEVLWYRNHIERLGIVHRISKQYRRNVYF